MKFGVQKPKLKRLGSRPSANVSEQAAPGPPATHFKVPAPALATRPEAQEQMMRSLPEAGVKSHGDLCSSE